MILIVFIYRDLATREIANDAIIRVLKSYTKRHPENTRSVGRATHDGSTHLPSFLFQEVESSEPTTTAATATATATAAGNSAND